MRSVPSAILAALVALVTIMGCGQGQAERPEPAPVAVTSVATAPGVRAESHGAPAADLAATAQSARKDVISKIGAVSSWQPPDEVDVIRPADDAHAARLLGGVDQPGTGSTPDNVAATARHGPDRVEIVLWPGGWERLTPLGRAVVLRHEMTHALLPPPGPQTPYWLSEGLAEFVAYETLSQADAPTHVGENLPDPASAAKLSVRTKGIQPDLSSLSDGTGAVDPELAYSLSYSAVRAVSRRHGAEQAVELYLRSAGRSGRPGETFEAAFRQSTGSDLTELSSWTSGDLTA